MGVWAIEMPISAEKLLLLATCRCLGAYFEPMNKAPALFDWRDIRQRLTHRGISWLVKWVLEPPLQFVLASTTTGTEV